MYDFDVVFIGSGHATWHGAVALVAAGKRVAIAEEDTIAGTCTNFGCNAKYLLDVPFDFVDGLAHYDGLGAPAVPAVDWPELMAYKKANITPMSGGMAAMFAQAGIEVLLGHASLADAHAVVVGERRVTAEYVVLGTGERPRRSNVPGAELLHDSRDFLDLDAFPARVAFIGAGIISLEFASIAAKLGARATVIHHNARALRNYPAAYVDRLVKKLEAEGVEFRFDERLEKAEPAAGDAVTLTLSSGAALEVDYALDAIGRTPNVEGLGLAGAGVAYSSRGIQVDDHLRTTVPTIFASGDCIDKRIPKLTPTAEFESNYVAGQILGNTEPISYPVVPNLVFSLPRIAQCGVTVNEAEAHPERYRVQSVPFGQMVPFMVKSDRDCDFTFVFDADNDLVGAALYGTDAGELVNLAAMIIDLGLTKADLSKMIFSFPGSTYAFLSALMPLLK